MKILLTGHNGYIGSALHTVLQNAGHTVFGIDLKTGDDLLFFDKWPENIDLVIHLAGKSGVRESIKDPASYWMNNIEASKRLFARYGDKCRIIYASSSSAYEPDLNPYAASKYCLEELAERYHRSQSSIQQKRNGQIPDSSKPCRPSISHRKH